MVDAGKLALAWFAEAVALGVEVHVGEAVTPGRAGDRDLRRWLVD